PIKILVHLPSQTNLHIPIEAPMAQSLPSILQNLEFGCGPAITGVFGLPMCPESPTATVAALNLIDAFVADCKVSMRAGDYDTMLPLTPTLTGVGIIGCFGYQLPINDNPAILGIRFAEDFLNRFDRLDPNIRLQVGPVVCRLAVDVASCHEARAISSSLIKPWEIRLTKHKEIREHWECL